MRDHAAVGSPGCARIYPLLAEIERHWALDRRFEPGMPAETRKRLYAGWRDAVARVSETRTPKDRTGGIS